MIEFNIVCSKCGQKLEETNVYNDKKPKEEKEENQTNWVEIDVRPCEYCLKKERDRISELIRPAYEALLNSKKR
jgi:hypothetical protein